ncbi:MAG: ornithine cyclodeaminase family protein, partial [Gemmatimonadota bacterium]
MSAGKLLYLSREDVETVGLSMAEIIEALETMFLAKGKGEVEMPPKPGIHPRKDSFIHAMPAYISSMGAAGIKWVSGYPSNVERDLPYISGLLMLNDPDTGIPIAVMDATWITAMRTGAATAVAAKYLARSDSTTLGVLACGVQGRSNLEALSCVFDLENVKAYDISSGIAQRYAVEMSEKFGVAVEVVPNPRDAVSGLDLVVTS